MTVRTYQKKPVKIEAIQFIGFTDKEQADPEVRKPKNTAEILEWMGDTQLVRFGFTRVNDTYVPILVIQTLEGEMTASVGDYIIKGVKGEFYPRKPDIFELSYEQVA